MWKNKKGNGANTCKIHGGDLEKDEVQIRYGLYRFSNEYIKARSDLFPNSHSFVLGGCYVDPSFAKMADIQFCAACRHAEQTWVANNKKFAPFN